MAHIYGIHLRQLHGHSYQPGAVQFCETDESQSWTPDINAFLCAQRVSICIGLAGVEPRTLDLHLEPRRVLIRGWRESPEPPNSQGKQLKPLALEIDYGPFEREVPLPVEVATERATAEHHNGLLWLHLPLR